MHIIKSLLFSAFLFVGILSSAWIFSQSEEFIKPFIFVDSMSEIPESPKEREAYFYILLDYEKELFKGFKGYLELLYGNVLSWGYKGREATTEVIKTDFMFQTEIIEMAGNNILMNNLFSREELFDYQSMIRRQFETFQQLFQR